MDNLKYIKDISWEEIFNTWYEREGSREEWQNFATEDKGWPDWKSWRKASADFIEADKRKWKLYEIENPNKFIPQCLIGPWKSWKKNFAEKNKHTFENLVLTCPDWVKDNEKVQQIKKNFPEKTQFIGIHFKEDGHFVIFEGSHRADDALLDEVRTTPLHHLLDVGAGLVHRLAKPVEDGSRELGRLGDVGVEIGIGVLHVLSVLSCRPA